MASSDFSGDEITTFASGNKSSPADLRILHYNDVYHIEPGSAEPVGGVSRFQTLCNYYRSDERFKGQPNLITLFSGDAFNPSLESSVTKGSHMVPFLNSVGTDCACVGNHDLDFGVFQFEHLAAQCSFPWLLANVLDPGLGEDVPLGHAKKTLMLMSSNGIKVGLIGLVEREWLDTINALPPNLIYKSASTTAKELVPGLREAGAEIVIAVTHQREPNDNKLAEKTPEGLIDIILGGHDHYYLHSVINGTHVLRSGSDFKQLSYIEARRKRDGSGKWDFDIIRRDVVRSITEDSATVELVQRLTSALKSKLEKPIGYTAAPLDARFTTVRTKESNLGNFVCDLMRSHHQGDCALMAAGTIRGDQIYPPGVIKLKDIMNCFPFEDPVVVIKVTGQALLEALENSVCKYPALEGRFPQVSRIMFEFDPEQPEGSRIQHVMVGEEPLDLQKKYVLVTRGYMARGKDGYTSLQVKSEGGSAEEVVSEENGILISIMLRQYFMSLRVMGKWSNWCSNLGKHWSKVHEGLRHHAAGEESKSSSPVTSSAHAEAAKMQAQPHGRRRREDKASETSSDSEVEYHDELDNVKTKFGERERVIIRKVMRKWWRLAGLPGYPRVCDDLSEGEFMANWTKAICPRLEGRIKEKGRT